MLLSGICLTAEMALWSSGVVIWIKSVVGITAFFYYLGVLWQRVLLQGVGSIYALWCSDGCWYLQLRGSREEFITIPGSLTDKTVVTSWLCILHFTPQTNVAQSFLTYTSVIFQDSLPKDHFLFLLSRLKTL